MATCGPAPDAWVRRDLAREAMRLGRVLAGPMPDQPEVHGLLALMELQASRFGARTDASGARRCCRTRIARALGPHPDPGRPCGFGPAIELRRPLGPCTVQAAIVGCHSRVASFAETDREAVVSLYDTLAQLAPSPVVE